MNRRIMVLVIVCLMLWLPDSLEAASVGNVSKEMEQYVEAMVEDANLPGVLVTVVKDGEEPVFIKKGYQNVKNEEPVTKDTRFEMGSNSKAFTGLGLWYLVEQGKISLDDPVKRYLPWFQLRYQGEEQEVFVKDLLYQTAGISSSTIGLIQPDKSEDALLSAVKELVKHETVSKAGESFLYATINYDCVGLLIETVTGESYEKFINETLLPRYGLKNTYAGKKEAGEDKLAATGYKTGLFGNIEYQAPIYRANTPAGYVVTDGNDLAKWLKLQLEAAMQKDTSDEVIVKSQVPDTRVKPLQVEPYSKAFQYGAGWLVFDNGVISHGGDNPDFSSYLLIDGKHGYAVGVLCNRDTSYTYGIAKGISDMLLGNEPAKAPADIFMEIITVARIGLAVASALLIWIMVLLVRKYICIRKNQYSLIQLAGKNKKKLIVCVVVMLLIIGIPAGFVWRSMYSLAFLSVWAPACLMVLLGELVLLFILGMANRMIHIILPKGDTL